ncbi:MAG: hypothetical protein Q7R60_00030 [bacterium]|nr:hypothetical protein [bacterium]
MAAISLAGPVLAAEPVGGPIRKTDWLDLFNPETVAVSSNTGFDAFIQKYLGLLLLVASIAAVFFIIYYSYLMITAQGQEEQFEKAKKGLIATVVGIIIIVLSGVIAVAVRNLALGTI